MISSISEIKSIYLHMQDDISRNIYSERLFYNMGGENRESRIRRIMDLQGSSKPLLDFLDINEDKIKIIFGAGYWGKQVKSLFSEVDWYCFVDNSITSKIMVDGLPCLSFSEVQNVLTEACFVVATSKYSKDITEQLISSNIPAERIFILEQHMNQLEHDCQYFDLDALNHDKEEVFVDIGALDGESTKQFISWSKGQFSHAYVIEPNPLMREAIIQKFLKDSRISVISKAMSDECKEALFYCDKEGHEGTSHLMDDASWKSGGGTIVSVVTLDSELADKRITFMKLDVEGLEKKVLAGSEEIIRKTKPKIAVCVYHRPEDMWEIPLLLLNFRSDYRFYIRHYSWDSDETVLYAI